jgi:flagellar basal-body rod protein FlgG
MQAQELAIDVIAHNLANVNTTGFKKSRATSRTCCTRR